MRPSPPPARKRFGGDLSGRLVVTAGLGGMGGAQPLAITMCGGTALCVETDLQRIERRIQTGYLDDRAGDLDDALRRLDAAAREAGEPLSIGLLGNAAEVLPELVRRGVHVDVVTDQTSAHDPLNGYIPAGLTMEQADVLRSSDPDEYLRRVGESAVTHVGAIRALQQAGAEAFDYGNALRGLAFEHGDKDAFSYPGFVPAYIRPLFCEGKGPFRWAALSGDPEDIYRTDAAILELFGDQEHIARWIRLAGEKVQFQGLPSRICWLGYGERHLAGLRFNEMVASGELKAPIVIGRDHLDTGSVASPQRETESMLDGSDAVADWPILNALLNTACGASWVSVHQGGGVGMGKSIHAGQVIVADGSPAGGRAAATGADRRPRDRRRAPRRRRLRAGDRGRPGDRHPDADARRGLIGARRPDQGPNQSRATTRCSAALRRPASSTRSTSAASRGSTGTARDPTGPPRTARRSSARRRAPARSGTLRSPAISRGRACSGSSPQSATVSGRWPARSRSSCESTSRTISAASLPSTRRRGPGAAASAEACR